MDIQGISSRPNANGASIDMTSPSIAPAPQTTVPMTATTEPASTPELSKGGLFLRLMQVYESQHPEEAKAFLQGVADKLNADAQTAGTFAPSLNAWADRFQKAADSGDLSNLLPTTQPAAHFSMRAYQAASQPIADQQASLDAVLVNSTLPPPGTELTADTLNALSNDLVNVATDSLRALNTLSTALAASNEPLSDTTLARTALLQTAADGGTPLIRNEAAGIPVPADTPDPTLAGGITPQLTTLSTPANTMTSLLDADVAAALSDTANAADASADTLGLASDDGTQSDAEALLQASLPTPQESTAALNVGILGSSLAASSLAAATALGVPSTSVPTITIPALPPIRTNDIGS